MAHLWPTKSQPGTTTNIFLSIGLWPSALWWRAPFVLQVRPDFELTGMAQEARRPLPPNRKLEAIFSSIRENQEINPFHAGSVLTGQDLAGTRKDHRLIRLSTGKGCLPHQCQHA